MIFFPYISEDSMKRKKNGKKKFRSFFFRLDLLQIFKSYMHHSNTVAGNENIYFFSVEIECQLSFFFLSPMYHRSAVYYSQNFFSAMGGRMDKRSFRVNCDRSLTFNWCI